MIRVIFACVLSVCYCIWLYLVQAIVLSMITGGLCLFAVVAMTSINTIIHLRWVSDKVLEHLDLVDLVSHICVRLHKIVICTVSYALKY